MLEPAVRPGPASAQHDPQAGTVAFEHRSFQQLLAQAGQAGGGETGSEEAGPAGNALAALGGLGRIENAALREVLAKAREAGGD